MNKFKLDEKLLRQKRKEVEDAIYYEMINESININKKLNKPVCSTENFEYLQNTKLEKLPGIEALIQFSKDEKTHKKYNILKLKNIMYNIQKSQGIPNKQKYLNFCLDLLNKIYKDNYYIFLNLDYSTKEGEDKTPEEVEKQKLKDYIEQYY